MIKSSWKFWPCWHVSGVCHLSSFEDVSHPCNDAMHAQKPMNCVWTVIITRLTIAAIYHLWWYRKKLFFKTVGEACLSAYLIFCEQGFIYLLDTISNKNNTLTIYFTTAKLLDKWFKTNTCVFTTLWAIFLETGTLPSQGMKQIMCIRKVSQLKQGVFFHFLPQILTEDRVHWKSQQQGKRQQTRDSNCKHNRSIVRITM